MTACFAAARQRRCHMSPVFRRAGPSLVGNILVLQAGARAWRWSGNAASPSTRSWLKALLLSICEIGLVAVVVAGAAADEVRF